MEVISTHVNVTLYYTRFQTCSKQKTAIVCGECSVNPIIE